MRLQGSKVSRVCAAHPFHLPPSSACPTGQRNATLGPGSNTLGKWLHLWRKNRDLSSHKSFICMSTEWSVITKTSLLPGFLVVPLLFYK